MGDVDLVRLDVEFSHGRVLFLETGERSYWLSGTGRCFMDDFGDEVILRFGVLMEGFTWLICVSFGKVHHSFFDIVLIVPCN